MTADITFEPAASEQIDDIGAWLYETGPEFFSYIFQGREAAIATLAVHWRLESGVFSHRHAVVAKRNGQTLGLELGFTRAEKAPHNQATGLRLQKDLGAAEFDAQMARLRDIGPQLLEAPGDAYFLQNLVVSPQARGCGCGKALLKHAFEQAKSQGLNTVHLDVLSNNPARSFYLANGMEDQVETYVPKLVREHNMPGSIRMVKQL